MTANRIIHHIFNQPDLRQVDQASLEQLVEKYPYFAAARMLLARKEFTDRKDLTAAALKKAQLYSNTPQQVHQFVTTPLSGPVAAPAQPVDAAPALAETGVSAEDQAILEELAAEDARNAAMVVEEAQAPVEVEVEKVNVPEAKEEKIEEPQAEVEVEEEIVEISQTGIEVDEEKVEEPQAEVEIEEEEEIEEPQAEIEEEKIEEPQAEVEIEEEKIEEPQTAALEPDEIVAIDYEAEKAAAEFEAARTSDAPDEIVAIDYEAEKAAAEFEAARTLRAPDDIIAIDYGAIREEEEEEKTEPEQYGPEPEEEEIVVETATVEGTGIALPAAVNGEGHAEPGDAAPIRIHPMDTPVEETVLTFQPLYTDDYFAYKKLKDPNSAEMMNEKAAAEMRSFTDWLRELKDNFAGKAPKDWYHQQMNKLYDDDEPEVSERVEKMAMESITLNDDIVSETLAEIWVRQHQHGKAIAIYQKLSLLNPDKNAYFAQKIKDLQLLTDNNK